MPAGDGMDCRLWMGGWVMYLASSYTWCLLTGLGGVALLATLATLATLAKGKRQSGKSESKGGRCSDKVESESEKWACVY